MLIYTAYIFTSTLSVFCYIRACWRYGADSYAMSAIVSFGRLVWPQLSVLIYTAYIFTSTLSVFCYIRACWRYGADSYAMSAIVSLCLRLMLLLGFALGYGCAQLPNSEPLVRTGVMVAVCVYMLLFVIVVWHFKISRRKAEPQVVVQKVVQSFDEPLVRTGVMVAVCVYMLLFVIVVWHFKISRRKAEPQVVVQKVVQSFEEANDARLNAIMARYGLTGRERDVYASLLKGGTAKSIASELGISHYTVQGYIQGLYSKLGVNKKEQAVELFYGFEEE